MKEQSNTEKSISLRIVLVAPPSGVDFGIQEGKGSNYKTIQVQRSKDSDLQFACNVSVKANRDDGPPNFVGNIVQEPPLGRFIYIDIGKSAGQINSEWQRRIKIPLVGITWEMIEKTVDDPKRFLQQPTIHAYQVRLYVHRISLLPSRW